MMKKTTMLLVASAMLLAACTKETAPDYNSETLTVNATITGSKTTADATGVRWNAGDEITVVCDGESYPFTTKSSGVTAPFTSTGGLTQGMVGDNSLVAYYACNMFGTFNIPQTQTITDGVSGSRLPMYAYTSSAPSEARIDMSFIPAASIIEVKLLPCEITVNKVEISPVREDGITGSMGGSFSVNPVSGKIISNGNIKSLEGVFQNAASVRNGLSVRMPAGWFSVDGGLKITITYNETSTYEEILFTDEVFSSYSGDGDEKSYKYIEIPVELFIGPRDYYVKADASQGSKGTSWEKPATLEYALASAESGSVIHIAAGTYTPSAPMKGYEGGDAAANTFEISSNISLRGGYPADAVTGAVADYTANQTIFSGSNSCHHVVCVTAPAESGKKVEISGLTISSGKSGGDGEIISAVNGKTYSDNYAGGLYASGSSLHLENVTISDNEGVSAAGAFLNGVNAEMINVRICGNASTANGGGIWINSSTVTMSGCFVENNTSGGVAAGLYIYSPAGESSDVTVTETTFSGNVSTVNFGGLYVRGGDATADVKASFTDCTIEMNKAAMGSGFGITYAAVQMTGCLVSENESSTNGANLVYPGAAVTMSNCLVRGNKAGLAAGIYEYTDGADVSLTIENSEFRENETAGRGGAVYTRGNSASGVAVLNVANSTFHQNISGSTGSAIALYGASGKYATANIYSSTITGNTCTRTSATPGGALGLETAGTTANVYNSIISGNVWSAAEASADCYKHASAVLNIYSGIAGSSVYGTEGTVLSGTSFDVSVLQNRTSAEKKTSVYAVSGGVAQTCGLNADELGNIAGTVFSDGVIGKDQWLNSRISKTAGAYVGQ